MKHAHESRPALAPAVCLVALLMLACSGGSPSAPPPGNGRIVLDPRILPLPLGGSASVSATVTDATGSVLPNTSISWMSRLPAIAAVDNSGNVFANAVGATTVVARANGAADSITVIVTDLLELEVQPAAATVAVGGTQQFTVIARNSLGQVVPAPPVTWASSNQAVGTIGQTGLATGRAKGTTSITAAGGGTTSLPATLTVQDVCSPAITLANSFEAALLFDWVYRATSEGGFVIDAEYHGDVTAKLDLLAATPFQIAWTGDVVGRASFKESKSDPTTPNSTSTLQGEGTIVPVLGLMPKMTLIVDPIACTYSVDAGITLNTLLTDRDGNQTRRDALIVNLHWGTRPLGTALDISLPSDANFEGRSQVWAAMNRDRDSFAPLGFAAELANPITNIMGRATVLWALVPK